VSPKPTASKNAQPTHRTMTKSDKNKLLTNNTILWLVAMVLPAFLHFALASTKFPWPMVLPLLLFGAMLASNNLLAKAIGDTKDESSSS
jgi:fatty acid desaturase